MAKNIEMNYKQGESEYEVLYPNVKVESVIDIEEHYYTKNEINGQISDIIPNPYGVLAVKATDDQGNPVSVQLTVNPQIDGSGTITTDSGSGLFVAFVNPATYNLTAPAGSEFIQYNIDIPNAQVKTNQVTNVNVSIEIVQSGEIEITSSRTIQFPVNFNIPIDIWGCGGGGGGGQGTKYDNDQGNRIIAGGGGGGYTKMLTGILVSNASIQVNIGSGGAKKDITWSVSHGMEGNDGGNTVIKKDGANWMTANGGKGGGFADGWPEIRRGGDGGSGGGYGQDGFGGEDGSNGSGSAGGTGQGSTTRIFADNNRQILCSGGGGAYIYWRSGEDDTVEGSNGGIGAGNGYAFLQPSDGLTIPEDLNASNFGCGGGGLGVFNTSGSVEITNSYSGAGMQGVVYIRWPSQST